MVEYDFGLCSIWVDRVDFTILFDTCFRQYLFPLSCHVYPTLSLSFSFFLTHWLHLQPCYLV